MDGLSNAAAVTEVLKFSGSVLAAVVRIYKDVKGARAEWFHLLQELACLISALEQIDHRIQSTLNTTYAHQFFGHVAPPSNSNPSTAVGTASSSSAAANSPVIHNPYSGQLERLAAGADINYIIGLMHETLKETDKIIGNWERRGLNREKVYWPFLKEKAKKNLKLLERYKTTLLTLLGLQSCSAMSFYANMQNELKDLMDLSVSKLDDIDQNLRSVQKGVQDVKVNVGKVKDDVQNLLQMVVCEQDEQKRQRKLEALGEAVNIISFWDREELSVEHQHVEPLDGTCSWITETEEFQGLLRGDCGQLQIYGPADSGKTIATIVCCEEIWKNWGIDTTTRGSIPHATITVLCRRYSHAEGDKPKSIAKQIMASICWQLFSRDPNSQLMQEKLAVFYEENVKALRRPSEVQESQLMELARQLLALFERTIITLDALDACSKSGLQDVISPFIDSVLGCESKPDQSGSLEVETTTRPKVCIISNFRNISETAHLTGETKNSLAMSYELSKKDLCAVVKDQINKSSKLVKFTSNLLDEVATMLIYNAKHVDRRFAWVKEQIHLLDEQAYHELGVRKALADPQGSLHGIYNAKLQSIGLDPWVRGILGPVFVWLDNAGTPCTLETAIEIATFDPCLKQMDPARRLIKADDLFEISNGLLEFDFSSESVCFSGQPMRKYFKDLLRGRMLSGQCPGWLSSIKFNDLRNSLDSYRGTNVTHQEAAATDDSYLQLEKGAKSGSDTGDTEDSLGVSEGDAKLDDCHKHRDEVHVLSVDKDGHVSNDAEASVVAFVEDEIGPGDQNKAPKSEGTGVTAAQYIHQNTLQNDAGSFNKPGREQLKSIMDLKRHRDFADVFKVAVAPRLFTLKERLIERAVSLGYLDYFEYIIQTCAMKPREHAFALAMAYFYGHDDVLSWYDCHFQAVTLEELFESLDSKEAEDITWILGKLEKLLDTATRQIPGVGNKNLSFYLIKVLHRYIGRTEFGGASESEMKGEEQRSRVWARLYLNLFRTILKAVLSAHQSNENIMVVVTDLEGASYRCLESFKPVCVGFAELQPKHVCIISQNIVGLETSSSGTLIYCTLPAGRYNNFFAWLVEDKNLSFEGFPWGASNSWYFSNARARRDILREIAEKNVNMLLAISMKFDYSRHFYKSTGRLDFQIGVLIALCLRSTLAEILEGPALEVEQFNRTFKIACEAGDWEMVEFAVSILPHCLSPGFHDLEQRSGGQPSSGDRSSASPNDKSTATKIRTSILGDGLLDAARYGHLVVVQGILGKVSNVEGGSSVDIDKIDRMGAAAEKIARIRGHQEVVEFLHAYQKERKREVATE